MEGDITKELTIHRTEVSKDQRFTLLSVGHTAHIAWDS